MVLTLQRVVNGCLFMVLMLDQRSKRSEAVSHVMIQVSRKMERPKA